MVRTFIFFNWTALRVVLTTGIALNEPENLPLGDIEWTHFTPVPFYTFLALHTVQNLSALVLRARSRGP